MIIWKKKKKYDVWLTTVFNGGYNRTDGHFQRCGDKKRQKSFNGGRGRRASYFNERFAWLPVKIENDGSGLISILPPSSLEEAVVSPKIYSVAGLLKETIFEFSSVSSPHHTASSIAKRAGGAQAIRKPGGNQFGARVLKLTKCRNSALIVGNFASAAESLF